MMTKNLRWNSRWDNESHFWSWPYSQLPLVLQVYISSIHAFDIFFKNKKHFLLSRTINREFFSLHLTQTHYNFGKKSRICYFHLKLKFNLFCHQTYFVGIQSIKSSKTCIMQKSMLGGYIIAILNLNSLFGCL